MTQNTPPGYVRVIWPKRRVMSAASDDLATNPRPQPKWDGLGWVRPQSEGKSANKCSAYVRIPSRPLEKHSSWSWLREYQECAKLSSWQRVATLKNLIYFDLFNTFLGVTTWSSQLVLCIYGNSFKSVGKAFHMKLVERMLRVCKAVIKAKGGYFEESKIYFDLFNAFLGLLHDSICVFS